MSKIETKQITLVSENGLVEKTLSIDNGGVVRIDGIEQAGIVSGTWTPIPVPATGAITSYTSSGKYTKIGNQVTVTFECILSNAGTGAGALKITGLPFITTKSFTGILGIEAFQSGAHIAGYLYNNEIQGIIQISNGASIIGTGRGVAMAFTYISV